MTRSLRKPPQNYASQFHQKSRHRLRASLARLKLDPLKGYENGKHRTYDQEIRLIRNDKEYPADALALLVETLDRVEADCRRAVTEAIDRARTGPRLR